MRGRGTRARDHNHPPTPHFLTLSLFRASYLYLYNTQRGVLVKQVYVGVTPSCLQPLHSDYVLAAQGTNAVWCLDAGMFR